MLTFHALLSVYVSDRIDTKISIGINKYRLQTLVFLLLYVSFLRRLLFAETTSASAIKSVVFVY